MIEIVIEQIMKVIRIKPLFKIKKNNRLNKLLELKNKLETKSQNLVIIISILV
jgi:hypothetical protein